MGENGVRVVFFAAFSSRVDARPPCSVMWTSGSGAKRLNPSSRSLTPFMLGG